MNAIQNPAKHGSSQKPFPIGRRNEKDKRNKEKRNSNKDNKAQGKSGGRGRRCVVRAGPGVRGAGGRHGGRADTVFKKRTNNPEGQGMAPEPLTLVFLKINSSSLSLSL